MFRWRRRRPKRNQDDASLEKEVLDETDLRDDVAGDGGSADSSGASGSAGDGPDGGISPDPAPADPGTSSSNGPDRS